MTTVRGPTAAIVNALAGGNGIVPVADPSDYLAYANRDTNQEITDQGISARSTGIRRGSAIPLSLPSPLRGWDAISGTDIDYSGADILYRVGEDKAYVEFETFGQEFRLTGSNGIVDWMVGILRRRGSDPQRIGHHGQCL
ncbi:hypothetical protein [Dokdonella sp.]|uniref:hypothetical protein n=1 Tax=Dokdonella sp. TaxID=2291710 RepID=UPI0035287E80